MGWLDTAISTGGAILGGLLSDGDTNKGTSGEIKNNTVTNVSIGDKDVIYRQQAVDAMDKLADQLAQFGATDRAFFDNVYQPFQQSIMDTNAALLPVIEQVAGATLEANARDLFGNEALKNTLRGRAGGTDAGIESTMASLRSQIDKIPSIEERVGKALASVEGQFKGAGKELARSFSSRGQAVSQSSQRDLAFEKARAKSGAAGLAAESSRAEQMAGAKLGVDAQLAASQTQAGLQSQATNSLVALQGAQQAGLSTPQVGGVTQAGNGLDAANIQAGVTVAAGTQTFGARTSDDTVTQTAKGLNMPNLTSGATGSLKQPTATMGIAQPGTELDRIQMGLSNPQ